jgi:hypothetical protein
VEIYIALGKFHAWKYRMRLGSTIIVLGNIWLNSAWRNPGSTIIEPFKIIELWKRIM